MIPEAGHHLWGWFWQLSNVRASTKQPISYPDIDSWARVTGTPVTPEECSIIIAMDAMFRKTLEEEIAANSARAEARQKQGSKSHGR